MLVKSIIKDIQSLGGKKFRDREGLFIAEGPKIVNELLEAHIEKVNGVYALDKWINNNEEWTAKTNVTEVTEAELKKISQLSTPNSVLAVVQQFDRPASIASKGKITLVLDTIQDPGNLGAIVRIADWFGINQVVCSNDSADVYNPKVVQATMGSIARVSVFYTDAEKWLGEQKDICIYAATLDGEDVAGIKKTEEGIIIIGNESKGVSPEILERADIKINIPKKGKAESLNAAVATGIILSHIV